MYPRICTGLPLFFPSTVLAWNLVLLITRFGKNFVLFTIFEKNPFIPSHTLYPPSDESNHYILNVRWRTDVFTETFEWAELAISGLEDRGLYWSKPSWLRRLKRRHHHQGNWLRIITSTCNNSPPTPLFSASYVTGATHHDVHAFTIEPFYTCIIVLLTAQSPMAAPPPCALSPPNTAWTNLHSGALDIHTI